MEEKGGRNEKDIVGNIQVNKGNSGTSFYATAIRQWIYYIKKSKKEGGGLE